MNDINLKIVKEYVDKKVAGTLTGKSAYQIAVDNGFVGTEQEWLAEIKNYEELNNKPQINGVALSGNKSGDDLELQKKLTAGENITIEGNVISATGGGVTSYNDLTDKPQINDVTLSGNKRNSDLGFSNFYYSENNPPIYTPSAVVYQLNDIWINTNTNTAFRLGYKSKYDLLWYPLRVKVFLNGGTPPEYENENAASLIYNAGDLWINRGIIGGVRPSYYSNGIYMCLGSQPQTTPPYNRYNISWVRLDTRIISAIVNANGTITFTDSEGNSFTTSGESVIGPQGAPGQDYILTAQDKTDIANIVLSELPTTEGVLYGNQSN